MQIKLSIIIPMRGGVQESWLDELLKVHGNVEFILVFPPGVSLFKNHDFRLRQLVSPIKGEVFQRTLALINASGEYVLSINCDEYIHPDICKITEDYFSVYPESYFFRLNQVIYPYGKFPYDKPWEIVPAVKNIPLRPTRTDKSLSGEEIASTMREIPISPLNNKFDLMAIWRGRKDQHGPHQENFDKKVWKNQLVQETLTGVVNTFTLYGPFKFIPFWTADRLVGLSVQARFFEPNRVVGHWLHAPEQLRTEDNPPDQPRNNRRYVLAELLILRQFSQFGYLWNLAVFDRGGIFMAWFPKDTLRNLAIKLGLKKSSAVKS